MPEQVVRSRLDKSPWPAEIIGPTAGQLETSDRSDPGSQHRVHRFLSALRKPTRPNHRLIYLRCGGEGAEHPAQPKRWARNSEKPI